jgi:anti-sigma-K factor RskA
MSAHPTREEDFDLYALGALDAEECGPFGEHVAVCAECAAKLAEARGRVVLLALAAPQVAPSSGAKQRLMARIHADAAASSQRAMNTEEPAEVRTRWWAAILVPALGALAVATIVLWMQNERLSRDIASMHGAIAVQQKEIDGAAKMIDLIGSTDTVVVNLAAQPGMPKGTAHVMYNMKMKTLMYDGELEAAPAGKSYQLWVVPTNGNPISAGVFTPVPGQTDHWMMDMPEGLVPKAFAVTVEPAGGMPQPTGPKVLLGAAS